jgi:hypothetical protein
VHSPRTRTLHCSLLSAWFYRGHSPNNDFFQVRPEFKEIREGKRPKVTFQEYLEMHEYQNIVTRMLGADSFPYRNVTVTEEVYSTLSPDYVALLLTLASPVVGVV